MLLITLFSGTDGRFCDRGGLEIYYTVAIYRRDSAHQDCERRTFLGSFRPTLLPEKICDLSSLRCNPVHSGRLNLANAWIPYRTCNAEIFNKPQKRRPGPPGPT